jgi:hypothetical protein
MHYKRASLRLLEPLLFQLLDPGAEEDRRELGEVTEVRFDSHAVKEELEELGADLLVGVQQREVCGERG